MYLGEITRNILVSLIDASPKPLLLGGKSTAVLNKHYGIDSSVMSDVEDAWEGKNVSEKADPHAVPAFSTFDDSKLSPAIKSNLERVRLVVAKQFGYKDSEVTLKDAAVCPKHVCVKSLIHQGSQIVRWACSLVARRAALLSGVAVAVVLLQTGRADLPDQSGKHVKRDQIEDINVGVDGRSVV